MDDISLSASYIYNANLKLNINESFIDFLTNQTFYSFEGDNLGNIPKGWNDTIPGYNLPTIFNGTRVIYEPEKGNVVLLKDDDAEKFSMLFQDISLQDHGTIKFQIKSTKVDSQNRGDAPVAFAILGILAGTEGFAAEIMIGINNNKFFTMQYLPSGKMEIVPITEAIPNKWYSVQIDFNLVNYNYKNLTYRTARISIIGYNSTEISLPFETEDFNPALNFICFGTSPQESNYNVYIDNVQYSWATYKLKATNRATYNFSSDKQGGIPSGWLDYFPDYNFSDYLNGSVYVLSSNDGHDGVVLMNDTSDTKSAVLCNEFNNRSFGSIEFWIKLSQTVSNEDDPVLLAALGGGNGSLNLPLGGLYVGGGAFIGAAFSESISCFKGITLALPERWYHCRIDFELTDGGYEGLEKDTMRFTINNKFSAVINLSGIEALTIYNYRVNMLGFMTSQLAANLSVYIDDVGYSWDSNYSIGDNLEIEFLNKHYFGAYELNTTTGEIYGTLEIWKESENVFANIKVIKPLNTEYYSNNTFPVYVNFSVSMRRPNVNLQEILENVLSINNFSFTLRFYGENFRLTAIDDDWDSNSILIPCNTDSLASMPLSPKIEEIYIPDIGEEDAELIFMINVSGNYPASNITVKWNFGDDSKLYEGYFVNGTFYGSHIYKRSGIYLCTVYAYIGDIFSKKGYEVIIEDVPPRVKIIDFVNYTMEDQPNRLNVKISDSPSDEDSLRYYWDFGDGTRAYSQSPEHSWRDSGIYNITVYVIDDDGVVSYDTKTIKVDNFAPIIEGPFSFRAIEGDTLTLDVAFYNSFLDEYYELSHYWKIYDSEGNLIYESAERKPSLTLDDGKYYAILTVADNSGATSTANISIDVINIPPT
ncbi:MAG: PKD domain-containing protein, partial [Promethearchaeota archaeon]